MPKEHRLVKAARAFENNPVPTNKLDKQADFNSQKEAVVRASLNLNWLERRGIGSGASSADANSFIYKNQAYAFLGSEIVHKYAKKSGYFELQGVQKGGSNEEIHVFPPGTKSGLRMIDGIQLGFEICRDVYTNVLEAEVNSKASTRPMIDIICSHWIQNVNRPVAEGGFVLHSLTNNRVHGVRRFAEGGYKAYGDPADDDKWCEFLGSSRIRELSVAHPLPER